MVTLSFRLPDKLKKQFLQLLRRVQKANPEVSQSSLLREGIALLIHKQEERKP